MIKQTMFKNYAYLLLAFMLIGVYSCETESVEASTNEENLTQAKKGKVEFNLTQECSISESTNLYAGQNILVGTVDVVIEGDNYIITYNLTNEDYCITETHLSVVDTPSDFPLNGGGNPKIGQFVYSDSHDCESSVSYSVPTSEGAYIAAHAVVNCIPSYDISDIDASLPEVADFCIRTGREVENSRGYLKFTTNEDPIAGTYWAWCADRSRDIAASGEDKCYEDFNVYTLNDDLSAFIPQTDNLDNLLWLLNNVDSILDSGDYLYGNVQWAIWKLLNDDTCNNCNENLSLPPGDITVKGMEVYNMAITNGEGYEAGCGENTLVFFDDGVRQPVFIQIPIECDTNYTCSETAWGDGCDFPGNSWATYFHYQG